SARWEQRASVCRQASQMRRHPAARECNADPVVQAVRADIRPNNADPRAHLREDLVVPVDPVVRADRHRREDLVVPVVLVVPVDRRRNVGPTAHLRVVISEDRAVLVAPEARETSTTKVAPPSAHPTITIGGHRGTPGITIGAADSRERRGVAAYRPGAMVHRHRHHGTVRCQRRGGPHRRPSTTGASTSSRHGIRATTSGASISSESGFHYRSDTSSFERVADRQVL
ncbi:MAG: hypothetical protein QOD39_3165, partial [Mycobacterium sp.]|nr:hypothetical protein [Mycobacterium sp.]